MSKSVRSTGHTSVTNRPANTAKCSTDKARSRPKRKRGWLYRTFIGDDTEEVEEKPVKATRPFQGTLPPLRQPVNAPQRYPHPTDSAEPSGYDQWQSNNEILYRCVYPAPNRVVTDSTHVISPPLSLDQYMSMYSDASKMMPTYAYSQSSNV